MSASSSSHGTGSKDLDGAFYEAAMKGDFQAFENYAQPLDRLIFGENQNTILHVHLNTPNERSKKFVEKVLRKCPQLLWQTNNDGDVPLHIAAKVGYGDVPSQIGKVLIKEAKKPIHRDLERGEEEADSIRRMLRLTNKQEETALHLAFRDVKFGEKDFYIAQIGVVIFVEEIILKHEDPEYTYTANISGESPLYLAIRSHNFVAAIYILKKFESPDCDGPNGTTAFHAAASHPAISDRLIDLMLSRVGFCVNFADEIGWTPLHYGAYRYRKNFIRQILREYPNSAYATDKDRNRTALHIASCTDSPEIMKEIIDNCPKCCEIRDVRGWNVLHYAVISKCEEAVKVILKDPSLVYLIGERDVKGYTPFHLLVVSRPSSPLISWISEKSAVAPSKFWVHNLSSIFTRTYRIMLDDEDGSYKKEILEWMEDLGRDPYPSGETVVDEVRDIIKVRDTRRKEREEREEKVIPELEKAKESHLVAAALVATVTFAAAFTLPGGYISDENGSNLKGTPILSRNAAFQVFIVTDAIAMVLSTSSVFIHFIMVLLGYKQRYYWLIRSAFWFIVVAMGAMVVAFVTGTYAVLAPNSKGLAIAICVIGLTFFFHVSYTIIRLIFDFIKRDREENWDSSTTETLGRLLESAPRYLSCGLKGHKEDEKETKKADET